MTHRKRIRRTRGFTLIELIVVLGIIGVLVGLAVPTIEGIFAEAEATAENAQERLISDAYQQWTAAGGTITGDDTDSPSAIFASFIVHIVKPAGAMTTTLNSNVTCSDNTPEAAEIRLKNVQQGDGDGTLTESGVVTLN